MWLGTGITYSIWPKLYSLIVEFWLDARALLVTNWHFWSCWRWHQSIGMLTIMPPPHLPPFFFHYPAEQWWEGFTHGGTPVTWHSISLNGDMFCADPLHLWNSFTFETSLRSLYVRTGEKVQQNGVRLTSLKHVWTQESEQVSIW